MVLESTDSRFEVGGSSCTMTHNAGGYLLALWRSGESRRQESVTAFGEAKMNFHKPILAFAVGVLFAAIVGPAVSDVKAQGRAPSDLHACVGGDKVLRMIPLDATCPSGQQSLVLKHAGDPDLDLEKPKDAKSTDLSPADKAILEGLDRRLKSLETLNCTMPGKSRVVAPFELKDANGKRIFYVDGNAVGLFNSDGNPVARISATPQGGLFIAEGGENKAFFGISDSVVGLGLRENKQLRVELGRNPEYGNYRLNFRSASGQTIAGFGIAADHQGMALIRDQSGNTKASMGISQNGAGLIEVLGGKPIGQLTEGNEHHGGKLWIGNAGGQGMVEAGDAGGYGIVKAGPLGFEFIPTPGLALPGSVIVGRR